MPVRALVDDCPLYDLEPLKPAAADLPAAKGHPRRRHRRRGDAAGAAGQPQHRLAPAAVRALRRDRPVADRPPARAGRRGRPGARRRQRPGGLDRLQRPPRRRRPPQRDDRDRHRVRREPRLRRRRAAGDDQQPQLRQPREAPHRLAADRGRGRPGGGLPGALGADRRRQRLALQRGRRRADLPDARDRHGRAPARRLSRRAHGLHRARAPRSPSSAPSRRRSMPPSSRSSAASRCPTASRRWSCPRSSRRSRPSAAPSARGRR